VDRESTQAFWVLSLRKTGVLDALSLPSVFTLDPARPYQLPFLLRLTGPDFIGDLAHLTSLAIWTIINDLVRTNLSF